MNLYFSPKIPGWNFDYSMLDENHIKEEEMKLKVLAEQLQANKNTRTPGFDSTDQEEESEEIEDDDEDEVMDYQEIGYDDFDNLEAMMQEEDNDEF